MDSDRLVCPHGALMTHRVAPRTVYSGACARLVGLVSNPRSISSNLILRPHHSINLPSRCVLWAACRFRVAANRAVEARTGKSKTGFNLHEVKVRTYGWDGTGSEVSVSTLVGPFPFYTDTSPSPTQYLITPCPITIAQNPRPGRWFCLDFWGPKRPREAHNLPAEPPKRGLLSATDTHWRCNAFGPPSNRSQVPSQLPTKTNHLNHPSNTQADR